MIEPEDCNKYPNVTECITREEQISFDITQGYNGVFSIGKNTKTIVETYFGWNEEKEIEKTRPPINNLSMEEDDNCDEWDDDFEENDLSTWEPEPFVPKDQWSEKLGATPRWEDLNETN